MIQMSNLVFSIKNRPFRVFIVFLLRLPLINSLVLPFFSEMEMKLHHIAMIYGQVLILHSLTPHPVLTFPSNKHVTTNFT